MVEFISTKVRQYVGVVRMYQNKALIDSSRNVGGGALLLTSYLTTSTPAPFQSSLQFCLTNTIHTLFITLDSL